MFYTRVPFIETIRRTAIAGATYVIRGEQRRAGDQLVVESVSYVNETTADKDLDWGMRVNGRDVWMNTIEGAAAGLFHRNTGRFTMPSEHRLIFRQLLPTAGDVTVINVVGYLLCPDNQLPQDV